MLKAVISDLSEVDDSLHGYYEEGDNGFKLKVDGLPRGGEDTSGLLDKNKELLGKVHSYKSELEQFREKEATERQKQLMEKNEFETILKERDDKHARIVESMQKQLDDRTEMAKNFIKGAEVNKLAGQLFGDAAEFMGSMVSDRINVNDNFELEFLNANNLPDPNMNGELLVDEFKKNPKLDRFIVGRQSSGGGSTGTSGTGGTALYSDYGKYYDVTGNEYNPMKQQEVQDNAPQMHEAFRKQHENFDINQVGRSQSFKVVPSKN